MDWQFIIVGAIIGMALFFVGRRFFNKINATRKNSACDIDCGCESKSKRISADFGRH